MRVLRRKLFNRGGYAHRGTGITSGLTPVQRFQGGGQATIRPEMLPTWMTFMGNLASGKSYKGGVGGAMDILGQATTATAPVLGKALAARRAKERKIIKGADGYQYYADTGERVLPDVVKANERKNSERYNTWLDTDPTPNDPPSAKDLETMGTFNEFLVKTEYIKPEKKEKHFWAVNKATGDDLRVTDTEFDSATMEKGRPDR